MYVYINIYIYIIPKCIYIRTHDIYDYMYRLIFTYVLNAIDMNTCAYMYVYIMYTYVVV